VVAKIATYNCIWLLGHSLLQTVPVVPNIYGDI